MNKLFYLAAALFVYSACGNKDEYVIRGSFPGLKDGMIVTLNNLEKEKKETLATDTVRNGRFELRGSTPTPVFCDIRISNRNLVQEKKEITNNGTFLFLDNSKMEMQAKHYDSLSYISTMFPVAKETNAKVTGGVLHADFNAYRQKMLPLELDAYIPYDTLSNLRFFNKYNYPAEVYAKIFAEFYPQQVEKQAIVDAARMEFIRQHPTSPVSLYIAENLIKEEFTRTKEELEELSRVAEQITDTIRKPRFLKRMEQAMRQYKGVKYTDVELETPVGTREKLSSHVHPGSYTLIDFWASWCGPCKAAIPSVKKLYNKYSREQLNVVSISMDEKKTDWEKAMKEEDMPWTQLRSNDRKSYTEIFKTYNVTSIPRLVLLDPAGRVVFSSHDADALQLTVRQLVENNQ